MLNNQINDEEYLYRTIRPLKFLWDFSRNRPSSAAFKDKAGLSVDRSADRNEEEIIESLNKRFPDSKAIVSISHQECKEIDVLVLYAPSKANKYHSEIHESVDKKCISNIKAKKLANQVCIHLN